MTALIFSTNHPEVEARILIEALTQWLAEQPETPVPLSKTTFQYDGDVLEAVRITLGCE